MPPPVQRTIRRAGALVLAAVLCAAAQAGETLRVLAWPGYADADIVKAFEERTRATVQLTVVSSDETLLERASADEAANFDVIAVNTAELKRYVDRGLVVPLEPSRIPNAARQLPRFRDRAAIPNLTRGGAVYAMPYTYSEMGLIYDRRQLAEPPTSISALWDPRWRGRVLAYDAGGHNFSIAALALGKPDPFRLDPAAWSEVVAHLVALRRNVLTFYSRPEESVELFRAHGVALMFANYGRQQVQQLRKAGVDIGYAIPREGALAWLDGWAIMRGARNRALAEAWIDYMLEPAVSRALTLRQGLPNTLEPGPLDEQPAKIVWLEPVEDASGRSALWSRIVSGDRPAALGLNRP